MQVNYYSGRPTADYSSPPCSVSHREVLSVYNRDGGGVGEDIFYILSVKSSLVEQGVLF